MKNQFKLFVKDSLWYSLKPIFTKLFNFILVPVYTAYLTPEEYGNLQYIIAFGMLFRALVNMGLDSSFWKFKSENSGYLKADVTLNFILFQLFTGVTVLLLALLVKVLLIEESFIMYLILIFLLAQTIKIVFDGAQILHRASHKSKLFLIGAIVQSLVLFALNILFIVVLEKNYVGVIYSYLIGYILMGFIFGRVILREAKGKINIKLTKEMLRYGIPLMIGNVAAFIITLSDRFFLKAFASSEELGLYSYGYKFGDLVNGLLISTFFLAWNPVRWDIFELPDGKELFSKFNKFLFIAIPFLGLIILGFAIFLAAILTVDEEYLKGIKIIYFIGFSYVLYGLYYFNTMGMLFTDRTKRITGIVLISAVLNLVLNFILIPTYGIFGAAIATVLGYFNMFVLARIYGQKYYPIDRNTFFEAVQLVLLLIILVFMTILAVRLSNLYVLGAITLIISLAIPVVNILFGFISKKDLYLVRELAQIARNKKKSNK